MASVNAYCFYKNKSARKYGEISLEKYLRNGLSHVFAGVRHPEDARLDAGDAGDWAFEDIVLASIKVCMLYGDPNPCPGPYSFVFRVPAARLSIVPSDLSPGAEEDALVEMLLNCESGTLDGLREIEQIKGVLILNTPVFCQIIVAMALSQGNRQLVKEIISRYPPAPGHELLFGTEKGGPTTDSAEVTFGSRRALSHKVFQGQADNGCELWSAMIRAGWAVPRRYMQAWAASSPSPAAGIELLKTLADRGVKIEKGTVDAALWYGHASVLDYVLSQYVPDNGDPLTCAVDEREAHDFLIAAARRKRGGVEQLEVLFQHDINDIHWMPEVDQNATADPRYLAELERNANLPQQTPLHAAAALGNLEVVE
ncbi:hypothetical protein SLS62_011400 [Diatrype stigma]|uniref:Uncharacterized protein n=1 Tax=Diatrype stigma TaxID=117547 RepID=A0AAN9U341_9PEZI